MGLRPALDHARARLVGQAELGLRAAAAAVRGEPVEPDRRRGIARDALTGAQQRAERLLRRRVTRLRGGAVERHRAGEVAGAVGLEGGAGLLGRGLVELLLPRIAQRDRRVHATRLERLLEPLA